VVTVARYALIITLLLATVVGLGVPSASADASSRAAYSRAVTQICSGARLFEDRHAIGTRAGALAVAQDIRASTRRRLLRVDALSVPRELEELTERWTTLERRLANAYAESWVGIYDVVAATDTQAQRARAPRLLRRLLHAPDRLRLAAAQIELTLRVPDCTGGATAPGDLSREGPAIMEERKPPRPGPTVILTTRGLVPGQPSRARACA
jgi:hypothetical protein